MIPFKLRSLILSFLKVTVSIITVINTFTIEVRGCFLDPTEVSVYVIRHCCPFTMTLPSKGNDWFVTPVPEEYSV